MKLHRARGRKAYCRDTLPCPKLHQRLAHKRSIPSTQRHWHLTPNFKPAGCFLRQVEISTAMPSQSGRLGERNECRGGLITQSVCNPHYTHIHTHSPWPPRLPVPVRFVWEQLSGWKYLILFLITQAAITVIKLSLRGLHCFSSNTTDRRQGC